MPATVDRRRLLVRDRRAPGPRSTARRYGPFLRRLQQWHGGFGRLETRLRAVDVELGDPAGIVAHLCQTQRLALVGNVVRATASWR